MHKCKIISLLIFSFFLTMATQTSAQEQQVHEIGLRMGGLNNFGFIYKKQTDENRYRRYRIGNVEANYGGSNTSLSDFENEEVSVRTGRFSLGFGLGFEKRKRITDKLKFIHGWAPQIGGSFSRTDREDLSVTGRETTSFNARVRIGYILGFQMPISNHFQVSIETIPYLGLSYNYSKNEEGDEVRTTNGLNTDLGFDANWIALSIMYRFTTK